MFKEAYLDQVKLLIKVLPDISKESCFALKGEPLLTYSCGIFSVSPRHVIA
jgi:hypothetical protein